MRVEKEPASRSLDVHDGAEAIVIYARRFRLRVRKRCALPLLVLLIEAVDEQRRIQGSASIVQVIRDCELVGVLELRPAGDFLLPIGQLGRVGRKALCSKNIFQSFGRILRRSASRSSQDKKEGKEKATGSPDD